MIEQSITLRVQNSSTFVDGKITGPVYKLFKQSLGYKDPDAMWKTGTGNPNWDGYVTTVCYSYKYCKCSIKKDGVHFPTGLLSRALDFFKAYGIPVSIIDEREDVVKNKNFSMSPNFELRQYQNDVVIKAIPDNTKKGGRGVIKVATGGGKTAIAAAIIGRAGVAPVVFYVTSRDLLKQAKDELEKFLLDDGQPVKVGMVGGGKCDIQDITVMTVQTAVRSLGAKFKKFDDEEEFDAIEEFDSSKFDQIHKFISSAKLMICDECITGDSLIITKKGYVKISQITNKIGEEILSFDGNSVVWKPITNFYRKGIKKILRIILLDGKILRCTEDHPIYTQRGWIKAGSLNKNDCVLCLANVDTVHFILEKMPEIQSCQSFKNTFPNVCDTNYVEVKSIEDCGEEEVFDITVEDTHCFFANGMLVHNCQHWAAETCQTIADHSDSAKYRFGMSATPWRDAGDDMLIDSCFGRPIAEINASFLIKEGILVRPSIYFVPVSCNVTGTYATAYSQGIAKNDERNNLIANITNQMVKNGRQILILVKLIEHGDILESLIPNSFFIHGAHTGKQRSDWLDKMRRREAPVTIATSIFDEGVDVKPLDGLILAGSGKSQTRALQRIGRVIRSYSDEKTGFVKKDAFIVDFMDDMKYMRNHSKRRKAMYETEPEFVIKVYQ